MFLLTAIALAGAHGSARFHSAFEGIEARAVDIQVQMAPGMLAFNAVGLPDKAVSEARERVRSAMIARANLASTHHRRLPAVVPPLEACRT